MKTEKFIENFLKSSVSKDFFKAKNEWKVHHLEYVENGECICGQKHLNKIVIMQNKHNSNVLSIGYTCYRTTLNGKNYDTEFKKLMYEFKLSRFGIYKIPTYEQILENYERNIINEWELCFLFNIKTKSIYSDKQLSIMQRIFKKFYFVENLPKQITNVSYILGDNEEVKEIHIYKNNQVFDYVLLNHILTRPINPEKWNIGLKPKNIYEINNHNSFN